MVVRSALGVWPAHEEVVMMRRWFTLACLVLGGLALLAAIGAPTAARAQTPGAARAVVVLTVTGAITPVTAWYVERGITEAERANAAAVVLQIDTPGGLDTAMRAIIQRILTSKVPVITYVSPTGARAASAGTFISYAAHVAAMAPSTTIGSASPVSLGESGQPQEQSETMTAKVMNDAVSYIRGLADLRGRNAAWAERAVREAANLPAREAHEQRVVDLIAADLPDLLRQAHGRQVALEQGVAVLDTAGATTRPVERSWIEGFMQLVADPTVAYLLLSLGLLGIYLEMANPGSLLPGVTGAILLVLALFSLGSLPVNWAGALLMVLAFVLFGIDLFTPTHGVLTVGGIVAFVLGSMLLINTDANPAFQIAPAAIAAVVVSMAAFSLGISTLVVRDLRRRPVSAASITLGAVGEARTPLRPGGMVFINGERWRAVSQSGPIESGATVRVVAVNGLELEVAAEPVAGAPPRKEQPA
jgi:membrane-bound serine protease (ClpP class)